MQGPGADAIRMSCFKLETQDDSSLLILWLGSIIMSLEVGGHLLTLMCVHLPMMTRDRMRAPSLLAPSPE